MYKPDYENEYFIKRKIVNCLVLYFKYLWHTMYWTNCRYFICNGLQDVMNTRINYNLK